MASAGYANLLRQILQEVDPVEGWLSRRETEFLALASAYPTAVGDILEIGSFRGRSTIALALANQFARSNSQVSSRLIAVDPMLDDDALMKKPLPKGFARHTFESNLSGAGVRDEVEFHEAFSYEIGPHWDRKLRLLWIDGDHRYASTKSDFDLFHAFLADGAILAMHDVLSPYDGCIRVFTEEVLTSAHVGATGLCGSIGWAQYWNEPRHEIDEERRKQGLLEKLKPLLPYHCCPEPPRGVSKLRYKWLRSRVPHRSINLEYWQQRVQAA